MKSRHDRIQTLLLTEIATKSIPAAIAFAFFAILVFFYQFHVVTYLPHLKLACVGVVIASAIRVFVSRTYSPVSDQGPYWKFIRYSVWLNTLCWSIVAAVVSWEHECTGFDYIAAMLLMMGFVAASLVTLSYDKWLFFPFNLLLLFPPASISLYLGLMLHNSSYYMQTISFFGFLLYQIRQYKEYRQVLIHRFDGQVDLEDSNFALKESQEKLINQTVQLIQASKTRALGEMAGGLSHEVNNSLMVILGTVRQLERRLKEDRVIDADYENRIQKMSGAIHKIKTVIDGLRYFSLEREHVPMETVSLGEIMERTLNYCQEMLKAHGVHVTVARVPAVFIDAHPMELTQAMFNIMKNADEAVSALEDTYQRWVRIGYELEDGKVHIRISNGGPVIPAENRDKLFLPFFTTKDVNEGTGLSLSIAKGILKEHGGDLSFDERDGVTNFVLELPTVSRRA